MYDPSPETINTAIGTIGLIAVAIIGPNGYRKIKERRKRRRVSDVSAEERGVAEEFVADPGKVVAQFLASNQQLTERVGRAEERVDALEKKLDAFRRAEREFRIALARWVRKILDDWGHEPEMPLPDEEDRDILADVIPAALEATRPRIPKH